MTDPEQLDSKKSVDDLLDEHRARESFANMIPSDFRNNPRAIFAKPSHEKEEVESTTRASMGTQEALKYLEICEAKPENLSKSERWGMRNLNKRIKKGELMVLETDKSGYLCVMPEGIEPHIQTRTKHHLQGEGLVSKRTEVNNYTSTVTHDKGLKGTRCIWGAYCKTSMLGIQFCDW